MERVDPKKFQRVLILAPIGRDATAIADLLNRAGMQGLICAGFEDFLSQLRTGADVAFVAEEGLFGQDLVLVEQWAAEQPPWSDIPFVMLTSRHDQPRVTTWRQHLVSILGNVALLERPVQPLTLISVVQAALRARLRQHQVRSLLEAREQAATQLELLVTERTGQLQEVNLQLRTEMAEKAKVEESLRHAQKLEALGQLTGGVAHDFNNLLMVITAGLDMIERQQVPERRARMLHGMRQAAQRGAGLTRQLLAFSRSHALRPETVDISAHLHTMKDLLDRSLRGDISVYFELPADLWPVEVDPGELELVLLNLAVNARDAMPQGGTITIAATNHRAAGDGEAAQDFVALSVADTGQGMSDEVKAHVFEPFFTTKDVGKGSGLGLAQVYGFARQSGGTVRIESQVGLGTTITLLLPRSQNVVVVEAAAAPSSATAPHRKQGSILMVEDDSEVAALVHDMLTDLGYEVIQTSNPAAALGALANFRQLDLVFSDIMMPGGRSGLDLAREIRVRRPSLPVLLTSGFAERNLDEALALGIPVLSKPYGLEDLRIAILQAMKKAA